MQVSTCWTDSLPLSDSLTILEGLARPYCLRGGFHGARLLVLIEQGDWAAVANFELPLNVVQNVGELVACRQALGFFQKLEDLECGIDKRAVALAKFKESEIQCRNTNDLFRHVQRQTATLRRRDAQRLYAAARKIWAVLGRCPSIEELTLKFGPGASTYIRKSQASVQRKLASRITCSSNLYASIRFPELLHSLPHWVDSHAEKWAIDDEGFLYAQLPVDLCPGKLEFVPKNARTYRGIVVEPSLNSVLQLGIGDYIARRLKRIGVDISDQTRNGELARRGSIANDLATLDLSSASDTISIELVRLLLPDDWFRLLNAARTSRISIKGESEEVTLEKFSSMGNGFTFPLETLIFWALTVSCCPIGASGDIGVYGDDIICPSGSVDDVIGILTLCGFSVNTEKSFWDGPFRESCGRDYYLGIACRPYYQKHLVSGRTLFTAHNYFIRNFDDEGAAAVLDAIPRPLRLYGPDGYGDGHLVSELYPRSTKKKLVDKGYEGHFFETFTLGARREISRFPGDWVSPLYSIYVKGRDTQLDPDVSRLQFAPDGRPFWPLPGSSGYKKVAIYSLG